MQLGCGVAKVVCWLSRESCLLKRIVCFQGCHLKCLKPEQPHKLFLDIFALSSSDINEVNYMAHIPFLLGNILLSYPFNAVCKICVSSDVFLCLALLKQENMNIQNAIKDPRSQLPIKNVYQYIVINNNNNNNN